MVRQFLWAMARQHIMAGAREGAKLLTSWPGSIEKEEKARILQS
jgi:hypothetical protein